MMWNRAVPENPTSPTHERMNFPAPMLPLFFLHADLERASNLQPAGSHAQPFEDWPHEGM